MNDISVEYGTTSDGLMAARSMGSPISPFRSRKASRSCPAGSSTGRLANGPGQMSIAPKVPWLMKSPSAPILPTSRCMSANATRSVASIRSCAFPRLGACLNRRPSTRRGSSFIPLPAMAASSSTGHAMRGWIPRCDYLAAGMKKTPNGRSSPQVTRTCSHTANRRWRTGRCGIGILMLGRRSMAASCQRQNRSPVTASSLPDATQRTG